MAYSTNIYDLYKKVEENHQRLDEAQEDIFIKKGDTEKIAKQVAKNAKGLGLRSASVGASVRVIGPRKKVSDFLRTVIGRSSTGDATTAGMTTPMADKMLKKAMNEEAELDEMDMKFVLINMQGKVQGYASDEKDAKDIARRTKSTMHPIKKKITDKTLEKMNALAKTPKELKDLGIIEEVELEEKFSPKEIKMAIGIASDPRYAKGNMTGAVKAIEKMKKGLSNHPQVAAVLKRQNEGFASDAQRRAAFAQGYKAKGKKGKKEEVKEKLMNAYRQQWKELGEKRDPADIDVKATSKDQEMADQNVVMQLRRAGNLGGTKEVKFGDGKKVKVKPQIAQRVMSKMMTLRTTQEKEKFQKQIGKSYRDLLNALK